MTYLRVKLQRPHTGAADEVEKRFAKKLLVAVRISEILYMCVFSGNVFRRLESDEMEASAVAVEELAGAGVAIIVVIAIVCVCVCVCCIVI
ncbi:hypothetical protein Tco_1566394 [Tanacetum coccineum]